MIEVVRGGLDPARADELVALWTGHGVLTEPDARTRLDDVVCIVVDAGAIVGVSSAFEAEVPHFGNRRLWLYRRFAPSLTRELDDELLAATFDALATEHEPGGPGPIGLCVAVDPGSGPALGADAILPTGFVHAGYESGGRPLRVRYFDDARIAPGEDRSERIDSIQAALPPGCSLAVFAEQDRITAQDVLDLWSRETNLSRDEAQRRLGEVFMVAVDADTGLVGVLSAYLTRVKQLGVALWVIRALVATEHRRGNIVHRLYYDAFDELEARFVSGVDARGAGLFMVLEDRSLRVRYTQAVLPSGNRYVGDSPRGEPMFVRWFQGATVPARDPRN